MGCELGKCVVRWSIALESLEARQMMSASSAPSAKPAVHTVAAVHAKPHVVKKPAHAKKKPRATVVTPATKIAWNDLVGTWTGTFTSRSGEPAAALSVTFEGRFGQSNTGRYNLSAMVGQLSVLTTVTPDSLG